MNNINHFPVLFAVMICAFLFSTRSARASDCGTVLAGGDSRGYIGEGGNYVPDGKCRVRRISREACEGVGGDFQDDKGAGYSTCVYDKPAADRSERSPARDTLVIKCGYSEKSTRIAFSIAEVKIGVLELPYNCQLREARLLDESLVYIACLARTELDYVVAEELLSFGIDRKTGTGTETSTNYIRNKKTGQETSPPTRNQSALYCRKMETHGF